jgi:hypothetical protein
MPRISKNGKITKNARIIHKLSLDLKILEGQEHLWKLRAKAKRLRINEVKRQVAKASR